MDNKTIFTKTAKGVGEAVGKTRALSRELRLVLKEVDGKTSLEELLDKISGLSLAKLHAALNKLSTEDYIREFVAPTFEDDALDFITILPLPTKTERTPGQRTRINEALRVQLEARAQAEVEAYERIEREQDERERRGAEQHARREHEKEAARAAQQQAMKEAQETARIEAEQRATQKIEEQAQQQAEQQARHDAEVAARQAAERQAAAAVEEQKRQEAEEQARQAAQAQARQAAEEKHRLEAEAKAKQDAGEKRRRDAEQQAQQELADQARRQAEEQARRDAEEQLRVTAQQLALENAAQQARRDAEEQARKETEEAKQAAHREAEEQARRTAEQAHAEEKKQAEERRRKLAVEHRAKRDAEVRAKRELEQQARREAEERARQQAEEESRRAAEERDRQELEQRARREEEERVRHEAEEKLRREEEERSRQELEQQARRAAEEDERARQGALQKARREAEDKAQREAAALADKNAEEEIRREFEELARQQAEAEARQKAEQARRQIEELAQRKAEAKAIKAEQERVRRESDKAEARREADVRARQEVEQWMREAAQEKTGLTAPQEIQSQREEQLEPDIEELAAQRIEQDERAYEEQDEQEPIEAQAEKKSFFRRGQKAYRTPVKWRKPAALALSLSIAGGLGLIHVMAFDSKAASFEKAATAQFQQPVKIGKLYLSLLPQPQWRLEDVSIGSDAQITISRINATTGLGSLYRGEADFKSIELQSPVFSEQAIEWLLFGQSRQPHFKVGRISASNAALASNNISLPRFNAAAAIGADGSWDTITVDSLDKKTRVQLRPGGATVLVELSADSFDMPFGSALRLDEFIANGTARRNELAITGFSGRLYDGILTGTAKLQWGTGWRMQGDVQAKLIDAAQVAPELLENGRLAGSATYVLEAEHADKLFGAPRAEGNFVVRNGTLTGVDFAKFLRSPNSTGTSSFAELTGNFMQANGKTQLQKVYMNAGLLSVTGNADMDQSENLSGRLAVELKSPTQQARSNLVVAGTLAAPQFSR